MALAGLTSSALHARHTAKMMTKTFISMFNLFNYFLLDEQVVRAECNECN
jgi:hypothetical protein